MGDEKRRERLTQDSMRKTTICLLVTAVTVISALLYLWTPPTMSDDIVYHFIWQKDWLAAMEPVRTLGDVIQSQITHYQVTNGRGLMHFIAQALINFLPPRATQGLNVIMFLTLIGSVAAYAAKDSTYYPVLTALVFGLLFLVINGFGTGFLWVMGAFNYVWPLTFTMAFLWTVRLLGHQRLTRYNAMLIPLSFLLGWTHEAISLPIAMAILAYLLLNSKKHILSHAATYCMAAYCCGTLMILLSPALWSRTDLGGITLQQRLFYGCVNMALGVRISWLLALTLLTLWIKDRRRLAESMATHGYMLVAWLTALAIVFVCGVTLERVAICADFIAMLIVLDLWQGEWLRRHQTLLTMLVVVAAVAVAIPAVSLCRQNYQNYEYHVGQLRQQDATLIRARQLPADLPDIMRRIAKRYVNPTIEYSYDNCYMAFDHRDINNRGIARLYGKGRVVFLPEDVLDNIGRDQEAYRQCRTDRHGNLLMLRLHPGQQVSRVTFLLGDEMPLRFYQRVMTYPADTFELDDFRHEVIEADNRRFLVMTVPPKNIARRIKRIHIE